MSPTHGFNPETIVVAASGQFVHVTFSVEVHSIGEALREAQKAEKFVEQVVKEHGFRVEGVVDSNGK